MMIEPTQPSQPSSFRSWNFYSSEQKHTLVIVSVKVIYLATLAFVMPWCLKLGTVQPLVIAGVSLLSTSLIMHLSSVYDPTLIATLRNKIDAVAGNFFDRYYLPWGIPPLACAVSLLSYPASIVLGILYGISQGIRIDREAAILAADMA